MSIPKVSRTLMLNLIYLLTITVLTFNISPGYVSTFRQLDKCLGNSSRLVARANDFIVQRTKENADENEKYKSVLEAAKEVRKISKEFCIYIDELKELIAAGDLPPGDPSIYYQVEDKKHANQPYNYKDKDITMRILLEEEKKGRALGKKIEETRTAMIGVVTDLLDSANYGMKVEEFEKLFGPHITLCTGDDWKNTGAPSWEHYIFNKMPVAATFAMLSKLKNDTQNSEAFLLGFLGCSIDCFRADFKILSIPKSSYVFEGEEFETEFYITPIGRPRMSFTIDVNGSSVRTKKNGIFTYKVRASGVGAKRYIVSSNCPSIATKENYCAKEEFRYVVGRRSATVSAGKMNVLYLGVDNPISITAPDVSSDKVKVSASGPVKMTSSGKNYIIKPTAVGEAVIKVTGPGIIQDFKFLVKPIPDPLATLNGKDASGEMDKESFKKENWVFAKLSDFDFDAECTIESFEMHRQPKRAESLSVKNIGGTFSKATQRLQSMAVSGDLYYFDKIMARCPGDAKARKINAMTWRIK